MGNIFPGVFISKTILMYLRCKYFRGEITIIEFRDFRLEDKPLIDDYFHQKRYEQADATFMTLFAWQKPYEIQWAEEDNVLYSTGRLPLSYFSR